MFPASLYLWRHLPANQGWSSSSAKVFLAIMPLLCLAYPLYNFFVDVPMYMKRYHADQAAGKVYLHFLPGLKDAAATRHQTHLLKDWSQDMFWMTVYFSFACWSGIALMWAPRLTRDEVVGGRDDEEVQLRHYQLMYGNDN
jgi:hypothetical protein